MKSVDLDIQDPNPVLQKKIAVYAQKFKDFDPRIIKGCALCYTYSPLYRRHINAPSFGKTMGWRLTHAWTRQPKLYGDLALVGPLDLGLFSVRIDAILGNIDLHAFVNEAKEMSIFTEYMYATKKFITSLIANKDIDWLNNDPNPAYKPFIALCKEYSPTFCKLMEQGEGDGWELVDIWSKNSAAITGLRSIFPLDVALYCVRLDSIIYDTDLTGFANVLNKNNYASILPIAVMQFVSQIQHEWRNKEGEKPAQKICAGDSLQIK